MWDLIQKGGWVMYPILAGSVIGLGLFFERLWVLQKRLINPPEVLQHLLHLIQNARWSETRVVCQRVHNPLTRIALAMLSVREKSLDRDAIRAAAEESGQREAFFLERGVGALGVVASLEPLLGLLGTVLGMIQAFRQVEIGGVGDPRVVAGGVWIALITTAVGLAIAIPAYLGYRVLLARVDRLVLDLQNDVSVLLDEMLLSHPTIVPPTPPAPSSIPTTPSFPAPVPSAMPGAMGMGSAQAGAPSGVQAGGMGTSFPAGQTPPPSGATSVPGGGDPKRKAGSEGRTPNQPFLLPPDGESSS